MRTWGARARRRAVQSEGDVGWKGCLLIASVHGNDRAAVRALLLVPVRTLITCPIPAREQGSYRASLGGLARPYCRGASYKAEYLIFGALVDIIVHACVPSATTQGWLPVWLVTALTYLANMTLRPARLHPTIAPLST